MKKHLLLLIIWVILYSACTNPDKEFQKAKSLNTIDAYTDFITRFPESELVEPAEFAICSLTFDAAKQSNTHEAYESFLSTYPESIYSEEAKYFLCLLAFNDVLNKNAIDDIQSFIDNYSSCILVDSARYHISRLLYKSTDKTNRTEKYLSIITDYPESVYADSAKLSIGFKETTSKKDGAVIKLQHRFLEETRLPYERLINYYNWNEVESVYAGEGNFTVTIGHGGSFLFDGDVVVGNVRFIGKVSFYRDYVYISKGTIIIYPLK